MGEPRIDCEEGVTTIMSTNYKDRIAKLEKENKKLKDELAIKNDRIACLNGEIKGLKFAIRANGINGVDVI